MAALRYTLSVRLWGDDKVFGPGVAELLEKVDEHKSIRKATMAMGMAYSKAWSIIKHAEEGLGFELVHGSSGGRGGGGAELTDKGREFLKAYGEFEGRLRQCADSAFTDIFKGE